MRVVILCVVGFDDVYGWFEGVEDKDDCVLDEVLLGEGEFVDVGWEDFFWNVKGVEYGLLLEVCVVYVVGESVDED